MKLKDYTNIEIGTTLNVRSRTDHTKILKRKIVSKHIKTTNYNFIQIRVGFKIGKYIVYPSMEDIEELNDDVKPFMVENEDEQVYKAVVEAETQGIDYWLFPGDSIYQKIGIYQGMDYKVSRIYTDSEWYLNDIGDILPKDKRTLVTA